MPCSQLSWSYSNVAPRGLPTLRCGNWLRRLRESVAEHSDQWKLMHVYTPTVQHWCALCCRARTNAQQYMNDEGVVYGNRKGLTDSRALCTLSLSTYSSSCFDGRLSLRCIVVRLDPQTPDHESAGRSCRPSRGHQYQGIHTS